MSVLTAECAVVEIPERTDGDQVGAELDDYRSYKGDKVECPVLVKGYRYAFI